MSKEIVVYWSTSLYPLLMPDIDPAVNDLISIVKDMSNESPWLSSDIKQCPAAINHLKNTYRVKFNGNYDITWTDDGAISSPESTDVNKKFLQVRDKNTGMFGLKTLSTVFFTEEPSLMMEVRNAVYARNDFRKYATFLEGTFDIAKWFRPTDFSFYIREKNKRININYGDSIYYVKFLTDQKVKLKKFHMSDTLSRLTGVLYDNRNLISNNMANSSIKDKLQRYYWAFAQTKYKKLFLKEIKDNLLE
jgi:hypothetical protein